MTQLETEQKKILEIHNSFDTAQDFLVKEAQAIINDSSKHDLKKAQRLEKLGFAQAKPVKDQSGLQQKQFEAQRLLDDIEYCRIAYPTYKFINEKYIQHICATYGLVWGDADKYCGDIPEKNLAEIEAFKLKAIDSKKDNRKNPFTIDDMLYFQPEQDNWKTFQESGMIFSSPRSYGRNRMANDMMQADIYMQQALMQAAQEREQKEKYAKPVFKMVAPLHDFNLNKAYGDHVKEFEIINEPVVLCPLRSGYLIISKWGLEASDPALLNEQHN